MLNRRGNTTRVTLTDVARASGFAPSTVSIVLNEAPLSKNIADRTKEQIRSTAKRLGYRPDAFARSLRSRRSNAVGIMVFDLSDPFCSQILRGIDRALRSTGYLPIVMNANNDRGQLGGYFDLLMEQRVEGLIVVANWIFEQGHLAEQLRNSRLPAIVVGRDLSAENISSIIVDNEQGGYLALQHLHDLGHREVAVIRGPEALNDSRLRWQGCRRLARENHFPIPRKLVRQLPNAVDPSSGFEGGLVLTQDLLRAGSPFSALVAFDDLTALGAVRALHMAGKRVPQDCSIVGFDDVPPAWLSTPPLTTLRQPMEEMGRLAAECVLAEIRAEMPAAAASTLRCLSPTLVLRGSTQPALAGALIDKQVRTG